MTMLQLTIRLYTVRSGGEEGTGWSAEREALSLSPERLGNDDDKTSAPRQRLTNNERQLRPSSAVDPNSNYWKYAEIARNETSARAWKLLPTLDSCFRLCNPETGLYLMVGENDFTYTVPSSLLQSQPREAFTFGPYYPQWPASLDALITNTRKQHQLCASLEDVPNMDRLIVAYSQQTAATHRAECRWQLQPVLCPRPDYC
uniref:Uncharacterized protein n=1 Tax=Anopheles atroparvus TaxID=41427 RepID=A0A182JEQ1_ANOAO